MKNARIKCQHFNLEEEEVVFHKGADMRSCVLGTVAQMFFPAHVITLQRGTEGNKGYLHNRIRISSGMKRFLQRKIQKENHRERKNKEWAESRETKESLPRNGKGT